MYWSCLVLLLSTKEDAAVYVAAFAAIRFLLEPRRRRECGVTFALAVGWFLFAVMVAIPHSRIVDGLPASNPFVESRYASDNAYIDAAELVRRAFSMRSLMQSSMLFAAFGLLPIAGPEWLLVIVAGLLINLAADPQSMQSTLAGHYSWPLLPWIAIAAVFGCARLQRRAPRVALLWGGGRDRDTVHVADVPNY